MFKQNDNPLVYSTDVGKIIIEKEKSVTPRTKSDGIIRIQHQKSGRKGKSVCVIAGLDLDDKTLKLLAAELKKKCGCGGAIKEGCIEIQGDKRSELKQILEVKGFIVKYCGG